MWRDRDPYRDHNFVSDTFWLVAAAVLFAACGLVWLIGQVAAILFSPHHEHLPVRLVDMLGVLLRLPGTWTTQPKPGHPPLSRCCLARSACTPLPSSPSGCPPWPTGYWSDCFPHGPAAAASNAGRGGRAGGSCVGSRGIPVLPLHYPLPHHGDLRPITGNRQLVTPALATGCSCRDPCCGQPAKHPLGALVPHGVKDATTNRARVLAWWTSHPQANIGLATGHRFDPYRWVAGRDLDTSPDEVPGVLLERLQLRQLQRPAVPVELPVVGDGPGDRYARAALAEELGRVAAARRGQRNQQLWKSTRNLYNLVATGALDQREVDQGLLDAAERCGLLADEPRQTRRTLASGRQVGLAHPGRPAHPINPERHHASPPPALRAVGEPAKERG